jgi:hypothetical protein
VFQRACDCGGAAQAALDPTHRKLDGGVRKAHCEQMLSPVVALTYRVTVDVPARIADIGEGLKSADCVKFV